MRICQGPPGPRNGTPLLLRNILPFGAMGLILAAYFSAILSTADSCLMAASGNILSDIFGKIRKFDHGHKNTLVYSKILTLVVGILALAIAIKMRVVLDLMLYSYAVMVSGLFIPIIAAIFLKLRNSNAAFFSMIFGGGTTLTLIIGDWPLPLGLDPNIFGITVSAIVFFLVNKFMLNKIKTIDYEIGNDDNC